MQIENILGVRFRDRALLERALIHGSHVHESENTTTASNERLEFLGDAVLGAVIAEALYRQMPEAGEGALTALRAALVRREALATVARSLGLGSFLRLGKGEAASGGRDKVRNLADTLEAIVGALYLDQGYDAAQSFVLRHFHAHIQAVTLHGTTPNYKAMLQEYLQSRDCPLPHYRIVRTEGPDHEKSFTAEVLVNDRVLGHGTGRNRKAAEMIAACHALSQLSQKED